MEVQDRGRVFEFGCPYVNTHIFNYLSLCRNSKISLLNVYALYFVSIYIIIIKINEKIE